jgi:hypothetical protein
MAQYNNHMRPVALANVFFCSSDILEDTLQSCKRMSKTPNQPKESTMNLGAFSVSLAVKDLETSRSFYEKARFQNLRRACFAKLADPEERRPCPRLVSRDVRKEHPHL